MSLPEAACGLIRLPLPTARIYACEKIAPQKIPANGGKQKAKYQYRAEFARLLGATRLKPPDNAREKKAPHGEGDDWGQGDGQGWGLGTKKKGQ